MTLRLLVADSPAERAAARRVEAQVFNETFGNTPTVMASEYGPFEDRSRFVVVVDEADGSALGTARLIVPTPGGRLKTLTDVAAGPWKLSAVQALHAAGIGDGLVWDVASLAVDARYRRGASGAEVSLALCHGIWKHAMNCQVQGMVTILDDGVLAVVQAIGLPWYPMDGATSHPYLGSPASTPCCFVMATAADHVRTYGADFVAALEHGTFTSIAVEPADLGAERGRSRSMATLTGSPSVQSR